MILKTLSVGQLQTNCYLIAEQQGGEAAIIDPGDEAGMIARAAEAFTVRYVINTHAHFDHMAANKALLQALRDHAQDPQTPELIAHPLAVPLLIAGGGAMLFGFPTIPSPKPDRLVRHGDQIALGSLTLKVLHTPGHSPESISLYAAAEKTLFCGDVLFRRGVGRFDLPGGSWRKLKQTIEERLFALPDDTVVYPGHGPPTTTGEERRENPFL
jgi:glyoxylase-like metal-dependent hydrolase (beta-lactamase superfamily II)